MPSPRFVTSFHHIAHTAPDATALVWRGRGYSYRRLRDMVIAARQGDHLSERKPDPICVPAHKTPATIALLIACWESGRPVLLSAPDYSAAVVDEVAARAGCSAVVSAVGDLERVDVRFLEPGEPTAPHSHGVPDQGLLLLATSGSTGQPKVVLTCGPGIDAFVDWARESLGLGAHTVALSYAPLNFDVALLDVWAVLDSGGCAVLAEPGESVSAQALATLITDNGVDLVQAVPLCFKVLADGQTGPFPSVGQVLVTGEALAPRLAKQLPDLFPDAAVANLYGCTETNDSFVHWATPEQLANGEALPIGRPLPGVDALILDDEGQTVEGPGRGTLMVASRFQALGYLDRALTESRFISGHPGRSAGPTCRAPRWFRSGDLVYRDPDGTYWLEGRNDFQVKVRGVRVTTTSVEDVLRTCRGVSDAAVVARPDELDGHCLHAVVEPASGPGRSTLTTLTLRRRCAEAFPAAVVPSSFAIADIPLPRTATGKIDRTAVEKRYLPQR